MISIETPRLLLRRWRDDDLSPLAAINADPEVMRWIGSGEGLDLATTLARIAANERRWDELGYGLFCVEVRQSGEVAGLTGLAIPSDIPDVMPSIEIGWRFGRAHWGQGLATEAAHAALRFAFVDRRLDRIVGIHQIENIASGRIMQKLGMRLIGESTEPPCDHPVLLYAITRAEYDQAEAARSTT